MRNLKKFKNLLLAIWVLVIIFAQTPIRANNSKIIDDPKEIIWITPVFELAGRVAIFKVMGKRFAVEQPISLRVSQNSTTKKTSIGFVHSGYSANDPDGKTGLLTISLETFNDPLTDTERNFITSGDLISFENAHLIASKEWFIDVELPNDKAEENRIKTALKLPRRISNFSSSISLQIKWNNISGDKLYSYLADEKSGLRFLLTSKSEIESNVILKGRFSTIKLQQWWTKIAGDAEAIVWEGNMTPLVSSLLYEGCFVFDGTEDSLFSFGNLALASKLNDKLETIVQKSDDGKILLQKSALFSSNSLITTEFLVSAPITLRTDLFPGGILLQNPKLVKDLSGDSEGLEILKGK